MARIRVADHASVPFHRTLSSPWVFLVRMLIFLALIGFGAVILNASSQNGLVNTIAKNVQLNLFILFVLTVGIIYAFRQVIRLFREIRWVNAFRIADPGLAFEHQPILLAPMATMLRDRRGHISLSTSSMRSIMDSIGSRLDEARDTGRYMVGLLVFLGLLGTFWGLLQTIQSINQTFEALDTAGSDAVSVFASLKQGLQEPLKGMGTAFSSSLLGLAGSLILGFLELQANASHSRFYNELEEWLSGITELTPGGAETIEAGAQASDQLQYAVFEIQRSLSELAETMRTGDAAGAGVNGTGDEPVRELAKGVDQLVRQMRAEQKVVREWVDEQAAQQSEVASVLKNLASNVPYKR